MELTRLPNPSGCVLCSNEFILQRYLIPNEKQSLSKPANFVSLTRDVHHDKFSQITREKLNILAFFFPNFHTHSPEREKNEREAHDPACRKPSSATWWT